MGLGSTFSEANIRNQGCGGHGTRARLSGRLARIIRIMWGLQHEPVGFGKSAFERWREDNEVAYQCCMSHPKSAVSLNTYQLVFSASCTTKQHETTSRPGLVRVNFALHAFAVFDIGASGHESCVARWLAISIHPHSGWDLMRCIQSYHWEHCLQTTRCLSLVVGHPKRLQKKEKSTKKCTFCSWNRAAKFSQCSPNFRFWKLMNYQHDVTCNLTIWM